MLKIWMAFEGLNFKGLAVYYLVYMQTVVFLNFQ
jgi:hypothetical protein